jgi:hypothetical protein
MIKNYRISVDGQFYTGEKEATLNTWRSDPWSGKSFQTKCEQRNVLTFEPKENNNFKTIVGVKLLMGEVKRIIEFINYTGLMVGNEIIIEAEPYKVPLELNIDYFLGLESELSRQKAINKELKTQLDIATDLGQKRFERIEELIKLCNQTYADKNALAAALLGSIKTNWYNLIKAVKKTEDTMYDKNLEREKMLEINKQACEVERTLIDLVDKISTLSYLKPELLPKLKQASEMREAATNFRSQLPTYADIMKIQ